MVGAAGQHNNVAVLRAGAGNDLGSLGAHLGHVVLVLIIRGINGGMYFLNRDAGEILVQNGREALGKVLAAGQVDVIINELGIFQFRAVADQNFGIISNHGAVIMVIAQVFVHIVAHAGVEHSVHAHLAQFGNMAVAELCREAGGIAGDGGLAFLVQLAAGNRADLDGKAQLGKEGMPERQQLIHVQAERNADDPAGIALVFRLIIQQQLELVGVQVQIIAGCLAGHRLIAAVAGNIALAIGKHIDGQLAVVAAAAALDGADLLFKVFQLVLGQHGAHLARCGAGFAVQRSAVSAHQARNVRADNIDAHLFFKGAQNRFIIECTALHHNVAAQFFRAGSTDHLIQCVLDHRDGQASADVFNGSAVLLGLLDTGVHEHRAAAAKVNGLIGKQAKGGKLLDIIAQCLGKGLQKAAAARGTGFVQEDIADGPVLDLKALHILATDINDEINVGHKVLGGSKVGHSFYQAAVTMERILDQLFAVTGGGHAGDLQTGVPLVQFQQRFPHQGQRVAQVGLVAGEQDIIILVDHHQLDGGGTGVNTDMHRAAVRAKRHARHRGFQVAGMEVLIFLLILEQGRQADVSCGGAVFIQAAGNLIQIKLLVCIERSSQRHVQQAVFRAGTGHMQGFVKAFAQHGGESQRPAQVQNIALDGAALCQAGNGLVDHSLINGSRNIPRLCALVDQGLDVAFGKHTAAGCNGVSTGGFLRRLIHLICAHLQQGGHLVNKCAGAACAAAVHAHFGTVGQEQDLGILAAQLNDAVGTRRQLVGGHAGGKHFLHKGHLAAVGKAHTSGTGDCQLCSAIRQIVLRGAVQQLLAFFQDMAVVALIGGIYDLLCIVQHDAFNGS